MELLAPQEMLMLKATGKCHGPNGTYELFIDQKGQPVVRSMLTMRKFKLGWENIVEMAVENGIDDKYVTDDKEAPGIFKPTYSMQCESGRFYDGRCVSVPFKE